MQADTILGLLDDHTPIHIYLYSRQFYPKWLTSEASLSAAQFLIDNKMQVQYR